jgi:hypothetical protein
MRRLVQPPFFGMRTYAAFPPSKMGNFTTFCPFRDTVQEVGRVFRRIRFSRGTGADYAGRGRTTLQSGTGKAFSGIRSPAL